MSFRTVELPSTGVKTPQTFPYFVLSVNPGFFLTQIYIKKKKKKYQKDPILT